MLPCTKSDETTSSMAADEAFLDHCIEYRVASTQTEREAAFRLLYKAYRRAELAVPSRHGIRVTPYHLLPTTNVFVARYGCNVISTVTLVEDGRLGLPMEEIYGQEIAELRQRGLYLAEVTSLADRRRDLHRFLPVFTRLSRLLVQFARNQRVDRLLIAVHPRHMRFYQTYMAFEPIAAERDYPSVQNQPAVAMSLDLKGIESRRPACYSTFFGLAIPDQQLLPHPIPAREQAYFRRFVDNQGRRTRCTLPPPSDPGRPIRST